jgi:hypothetical protein
MMYRLMVKCDKTATPLSKYRQLDRFKVAGGVEHKGLAFENVLLLLDGARRRMAVWVHDYKN